MDIQNSILDCIGHTPMVKLSRLSEGLGCTLLAKLDHLNPGGSVKDRIGIAMIRDAEAKGLLKPGGTITEGTAGNTGLGLAIAANTMGYKCVFCLPDKMSKEKIDLLRAYGAKVIVTPTAVDKHSPLHYANVARRIAKETPGGWFAGQFENQANPQVHYETTAREIWNQTDGKLTHFFAGAGTGGTITGVGKLLKEKNPKIKVVLCDPEGSFYGPYFRDRNAKPAPRSYTVEGIGLDYIPGTISFEHIDDVINVSDRESYLAARKLVRLEAIFTGGSSGNNLAGALKWLKQNPAGKDAMPVVFLCDVGDRYLSKMYSDDWMRDNGFLERSDVTAGEILLRQRGRRLVTAEPGQSLAEVMVQVKTLDLSQIPVLENGKPIGALYDSQLLKLLLDGRKLDQIKVREVMGDPLPVADEELTVSELLKIVDHAPHAALIQRASGDWGILTKADLVAVL
ncbi:MAG: pyridoxal-phosphate dependent enzyme [Planctomycetes bacterium]|jgi:cystathionine beta-synthase|nr:pyridoxal-phosphate dependent enzyme [Planctomycetota bacterium]MCL4730910.1 pyridoxal-phosphate dependent enzyme [Planctomycetota bacterium]